MTLDPVVIFHLDSVESSRMYEEVLVPTGARTSTMGEMKHSFIPGMSDF